MQTKFSDYVLMMEEFKQMEVRGYFSGVGYEEEGGTAMETEKVAPAIKKLLEKGVFEGKRVLDYGAGKGRHSRLLRANGVEVFGYDPFNGTDEDGWKGVAKALPKGSSFDVVICAYVINVVQKKVQDSILKEIHKLAKTDAFVISRSEDVLVLAKGIYKNYSEGKSTKETKLFEAFFMDEFAKTEEEKQAFMDGKLDAKTLNELCFFGFPTTKGFQRIPNDSDVVAMGYEPMTLSGKYKSYRKG